MNDTPLGKVIEIRSEDDAEIIKNMTDEQHKIRNDWQNFINSHITYSEEDMQKQSEMLEKMMASLFG